MIYELCRLLPIFKKAYDDFLPKKMSYDSNQFSTSGLFVASSICSDPRRIIRRHLNNLFIVRPRTIFTF